MPDGILYLDGGCEPLKKLREQGRTLVTANGAFDVLHCGHLFFLEEAKRQGDVLVVGLNSDSSYRQYKNPRGPVNSQDDRARLLLGLKPVDYVVIFDEADPLRLLEIVRPHVHVNGAEYGNDCLEAPLLQKLGARLHLVPRLDDRSTSGLIGRMASRSRT